MVDDKTRKFMVQPAIQWIKYSEPKIITYLGIGIIIGIIFIISVFCTGNSLNKKIDKIENKLELLSNNVINSINCLSSTIETGVRALNVLLKSPGETTSEVFDKK